MKPTQRKRENTKIKGIGLCFQGSAALCQTKEVGNSDLCVNKKTIVLEGGRKEEEEK